MQKYIVTGGQRFTDIDVLACAAAYSELLNREGNESEVVLPGAFNASITQTIRDWDLSYRTAPSQTDATYVVVDVSDPEHIATCARDGKIVEVFDHHTGFEAYWHERLGDKSHIEFIGACATLIWEEYKKRCVEIGQQSANLLAVAILSNTLNFGAQITHARDREAYQELQKLHPLSEQWIKQYFIDQEQYVSKDVAGAIENDVKVVSNLGLDHPVVIGQLELWHGDSFILHNQAAIKGTLGRFGSPYWLMTVPSLSESKNYLYTESSVLQKLLSKALGCTFQDSRGATDKLWLRKEILKKLYELQN